MKHIILLILLLPMALTAKTKLDPKTSKEILSFTLFNYDNLIADSYETESPYINQLAYLLSNSTKVPESRYHNLLNEKPLKTESNPVKYMMKLNKKTKDISGYYFLNE